MVEQCRLIDRMLALFFFSGGPTNRFRTLLDFFRLHEGVKVRAVQGISLHHCPGFLRGQVQPMARLDTNATYIRRALAFRQALPQQLAQQLVMVAYQLNAIHGTRGLYLARTNRTLFMVQNSTVQGAVVVNISDGPSFVKVLLLFLVQSSHQLPKHFGFLFDVVKSTSNFKIIKSKTYLDILPTRKGAFQCGKVRFKNRNDCSEQRNAA